MRILLDTHVFLWYLAADPKLPASFRSAAQDPENEVFISTVSVWEAVVKYQLGKLSLPAPPAEYLPVQREAHGMASRPVDEGAMKQLAVLPRLHRDPFDRLLVAQSLQHDLTIATVDSTVLAYPIKSLDAG